ncbi:AAA family ATPase [Acuticoccus sp. MNP-M23]|uniref:bifunctional aminoglycoside phosphotransferase/ATP-binding protein n=1 Tax=Acuticoccus sp. MNP-M23 TaxID=3072793 RepID=UPI0028164091|nr:AAA family ATPase [Acuticoccus sp. MNP-M23]WMS42636.1 AAA family ATPase [Acuticoccus sp. MNP-M23]
MMEDPARPSAPATGQDAVVAFLASPAAHDGVMPEHIETHLSHIFLAGERVLKLKKARHWSVVDYSTVPQRAHYCREEVRRNAATAPDIYLGVRPVTSGEHLAIGGDGVPVDWVVEMRRFAKDAQLDAMVDAGTVTPAQIDGTADAIAALHRAASIRRRPDQVASMRALAAQLAQDLTGQLTTPALKTAVAAWAGATDALIARHARLLEARARHGFVRLCHGDLHLSNICLWQGKPTPFDALEFAETMATIDVLHDLAFVLVDLEQRGRDDLSSRLLSRYLEWTRDYGGLALLPLFKGLRAMVRALVAVTKARDPAPAIKAAEAAVLRSPVPRLVAIGGLSGTGKTTLARALCPRLSAVVLRSDTTRKHLAGVLPETPLPPSAYCASETRRVYQRMRVDAARALRAGWPAIVDATFTEDAERNAVRALAAAHGAPFTGVWLEAPADTLAARVAARTGDASDADISVLRAQQRSAGRPRDWAVLDARDNVARLAEEVAKSCG